MNCPKCGKEIAKDSFFCEYCGTQVKKNRKPLLITIFVIIVMLALGGFGYYQYDKAKQERLRFEKELAEAQQRKEEYNKMMSYKESYLNLIGEGDDLLDGKKYSESISKYKEALKFEDLYSGTEYASHFNKNVSGRISSAKQQQEEKKKQEEYARTHGSSNGYDWVDLGLSVKWATCNVGATTPEGYGDYFAWGAVSWKSEYTEDNSITYGKNITDIKGSVWYDAARANWGGTWRLPTKADLQELVDKCLWEWTKQNDVEGYKITGPNGNSIFLPAAGYRYGSSLDYAGERGYYWSSTPGESGSSRAFYLYFNSSEHSVDYDNRYFGQSVRPVSE